jgi:RecA/RadA recombinase
MSITFTGASPIPLVRAVTGYHSLDLAFGDKRGHLGLPLRSILEIYGPTGAGKSTLAWTLAARIASKISLADLENFDPEYMKILLESAGFSDKNGEVILRRNETDEKLLDEFEKDILDDSIQAAILDSVGAISPIAEFESTMSEQDMGRRAKLLAKFSRRATHHLRMKKTDSIVMYINHVLSVIGGRGSTTSGGDVSKYLASIRCRISKQEVTEDNSFIIEGKIEKNRYGLANAKFQVYYLSGKGIHQGLTAANDCIYLGLATNERVLKLNGRSFGYWKKLVEQADDDDLFIPFKEALKNMDNKEIKHDTTESE